MNRWFYFNLLLLLACMLTASLHSGPITTKTLPNGLKIVLEEDFSTSAVGIAALVSVGRVYEAEAEKGLSHLVEHCLFGTTKRFQPSELVQALHRKGAVQGGSTGVYHSYYTLLVPRDHIDTALDVLHEMLFEAKITEADLRFGQKTVSDETRLRQYDEVRGLYETLRVAYPDHPYGQIANTDEAVMALTRAKVFQHYKTFYAPNNILLAIVGNMHTDSIIRKIEMLFKDPSPQIKEPSGPPPPLGFSGFHNTTRRWPIQNKAYTNIFFATPGLFHPDYHTIEVLVEMLNSSTGPIKKAALDSKLARQIKLRNWSDRDLGGVMIESQPNDISQGSRLAEALIDAVVQFRAAGHRENELIAAKRRIKVSHAFHFESLWNRAQDLATAAARGDVRYYSEYLDRVEKVMVDDINRLVERYLVKDNLTVLNIVPEENPDPAVAELQRIEKAATRLPPRTEGTRVDYKATLYAGRAADSGARGGKRPAGPAEPSEKTITDKLDNGLQLLVRRRASSIVSFTLMFPGGSRYDPPGKEGLASLVSALLFNGSATLSMAETRQRIDYLGGRWKATLDRDFAYIDVSVSPEDFASAVELLADALSRPSFAAEELEKQKNRMRSLLEQRKADAGAVALDRLYQKVCGGSAYAHPVEGTVDSVRNLSLDDVRSFYARHYRADRGVLAVVGRRDVSAMLKIIKKNLSALAAAPSPPAVRPEKPAPPLYGLFRESLSGSQARIAIGIPLEEREVYPLANLLNRLLLTQIGFDLVLVKGISYSAAPALHYSDALSLIYFNITGNPRDVDQILEIAQSYLKQHKKEAVRPDEVKALVEGAIGELLVRSVPSSYLARNIAWHASIGLGADYYPDRLIRDLKAVTPERINSYARKNVDVEKLVTVIVTPPAKTARAGR